MKSAFPAPRALRDSSGVLITAAVHLVLGYVALTATGIVKVPNIIRPQAPVWIEEVAITQPEQTLERRGPAVAAALDASGTPGNVGIVIVHS